MQLVTRSINNGPNMDGHIFSLRKLLVNGTEKVSKFLIERLQAEKPVEMNKDGQLKTRKWVDN